jgi:hypothetical protein
MVFAHFRPADCEGLQKHLDKAGILAFIDPRSRFVTHLDMDASDVDVALSSFAAYFKKVGAAQAAD